MDLIREQILDRDVTTGSLHSTLWSPPQAMCHRMGSPLQARCHQGYTQHTGPQRKRCAAEWSPPCKQGAAKEKMSRSPKGIRISTPVALLANKVPPKVYKVHCGPQRKRCATKWCPPCKQGATKSLNCTTWSPSHAMCHRMRSP